MEQDPAICQFLQQLDAPLLLGLSGGPDSMALFHLLLLHQFPFEAVYVDHGWREQSAHEGTHLKKYCTEFQVPFHLEVLPPSKDDKNLEDTARKQRLEIYKQICTQQNLKGVLLGHHADDQAETVLKRLFEGASLPKLKGLQPQTKLGGLKIYRPLLKQTKKEILKWLEQNKISYFTDATNEDPKFLRTRLRNTLLPTLSKEFGKQISANLCRLAETATELSDFLEVQILPYRNLVQKTEEGISLDFSLNTPPTSFLWKAVIRDFFEQQQINLPHTVLDTILMHLQKCSVHTSLRLGKSTVQIHKQKLFFKHM